MTRIRISASGSTFCSIRQKTACQPVSRASARPASRLAGGARQCSADLPIWPPVWVRGLQHLCGAQETRDSGGRTMRSRQLLVWAVVVGAAAACAPDDDTTEETTTPPATETQPTTPEGVTGNMVIASGTFAPTATAGGTTISGTAEVRRAGAGTTGTTGTGTTGTGTTGTGTG